MTSPAHAVGLAMLLCLAGAVLCRLADGRRRLAGTLAFGVTFASALLVGTAACRVLLGGASLPTTLFAFPELGFALRLHVDGLSAIFLLLAALVATLAALYAPAYLNPPGKCHRPTGRYHPDFLLFLAALYGLLSTTDMLWFFLIFWQLMTLPGYRLIRLDTANEAHRRAANRYFWMMQLACGATLLGAGLLLPAEGPVAHGESLVRGDFEAVRLQLPALLSQHDPRVTIAFVLFLVGFGIKLGMWPFGPLWLPDAHPAAPAPVSAMLSGVMIKTGVYGMLRYFIWLIPAESRDAFPTQAWGFVLCALGTVTLLLGTARALLEERSKRLLAWSSIGQAGYILLAIGTCLTFLGCAPPYGTALAALALAAALLHTVNHGLLKSLLFFTAGSLEYRLGTQSLSQMGGLLRAMPWTAAAAVASSLAIAGVPLTNGFVSKWWLFTAIFQAAPAAPWLPLCGVIGVLTSALTLAVFLQYFGSAFLGRPGPASVTHASHPGTRDVPLPMRMAQIVPLVGCVLLGLLPSLGYYLVRSALEASPQGLATPLVSQIPLHPAAWGGLSALHQQAVVTPVLLLTCLGGLGFLAHCLARLGGAPRRAAAPWLCGYHREDQSPTYSAQSLYRPLKLWIGAALGPPPETLPSRSAGTRTVPAPGPAPETPPSR